MTIHTPLACETRREPAQAAAAPRYEIYRGIHKALRAFMADALLAVGRMDPLDEEEVAQTLLHLRGLLTLCAGHVRHENEFIHAAMEARRPGSSRGTGEDHAGHEDAIEALEVAVCAVERAPLAERGAVAMRLYRELALFVAENFEHMHVEESHNTAVLWEAYTDEEIRGIHGALLATIDPQEMAVVMRWMLPALSHPERVGMLQGLRATAPAPVFQGVLGIAQDHLTQRDWGKLARALGVPAVPGLVDAA